MDLEPGPDRLLADRATIGAPAHQLVRGDLVAQGASSPLRDEIALSFETSGRPATDRPSRPGRAAIKAVLAVPGR
jgi:hypothetical protein